MYRGLKRLCALSLVLALAAPVASQEAPEPEILAQPSLRPLALAMPGCQEFHNDCQVCTRGNGPGFTCSNVGIACTPNGTWRCTAAAQPTSRYVPAK